MSLIKVLRMKNVAVLMGDGAFALFFRPHPVVSAPEVCHLRQKKNIMPGVGVLGGGGLGAAGIDRYITFKIVDFRHVYPCFICRSRTPPSKKFRT